jgi:kynurenine formamidase
LNIGDILLENLFVPICLIDVRSEMHADFFLLPRHIEAYEKKYGLIPKRSLVIAQTGWEQFWSNPEQYQNRDATGRMHFPGFSPEAATLLIKKEIVGLGIDTLTPDGSHNTSPGETYPVHQIVLGAKKYIIENLAHLDRMPPSGAYAIVLPPKLRNATEASVRIIGLISKK